jgi:hypothetical protein
MYCRNAGLRFATRRASMRFDVHSAGIRSDWHVFVMCRYAIERARKATLRKAFKLCKPEALCAPTDVLLHLVTMLSPRLLQQHNDPGTLACRCACLPLCLQCNVPRVHVVVHICCAMNSTCTMPKVLCSQGCVNGDVALLKRNRWYTLPAGKVNRDVVILLQVSGRAWHVLLLRRNRTK